MARRISPRARRKRSRDRTGLLILLGSVGVVAVIGLVIALGSRTPVDEHTMCPRDRSLISGRYVLILDATDAFNPVQRAWIERKFAEIRDSIPTYGNVIVYAVRPADTALAMPLIDICNPGSGEEMSRWTQNPELWRRRWESRYVEPLDSVLVSLVSMEEAESSPIMETIQAASVRLPSASSEPRVARRMYLFSDMLQHGSRYSHYGSGPPSYPEFANDPWNRRLTTDLSRFAVEIFYARRDDPAALAVQGRSHIEFWDKYFTENGATVARVVWIDG